MDTKNKLNLWAEEVHKNGFKMGFKTSKSFFSAQSPFQQVDVIETESHGRMLLNDGLVMVTERDEFVYHDMITHVPMFTHPNPKNVLIIGGGDGGTLREVLRHRSVEKCVMVEIDEEVVNACKEFIPQTASEMSTNPKAEVLIDDGIKFVAETEEKFDVVLVDSTDPIGPAEPLFGKEFYGNVHRVLNEDGIVIAQGESPFWELGTQQSMIKNLNEVFKRTSIYNYSNMSYPAACWSFVYASKGLCPINDFNDARVVNSGLEFKYYNEEIHKAAFALPEFQRKALKHLLKI